MRPNTTLLRMLALVCTLGFAGAGHAVVQARSAVWSPGSASASHNDADAAYAATIAWRDGDTSEGSGDSPFCGTPRRGSTSVPPNCAIAGEVDARSGAGVIGDLGWLAAYARADDGGSANASASIVDTVTFASSGPATLNLLLDVDSVALSAYNGGASVSLEIHQLGAGTDATNVLLLGIYVQRSADDGDRSASWAIYAGAPFSDDPVLVDSGSILRQRYEATLDLDAMRCSALPNLPCFPLPPMALSVILETSAGCDEDGCLAVADASHSGYLGIGGSFTSAAGYGYTAYALAVPEAPSAVLLGAGLAVLVLGTRRRRRPARS